MTDRELIDRLAGELAGLARFLSVHIGSDHGDRTQARLLENFARDVDALRHARPTPEAGRWWVVDAQCVVGHANDEADARGCVVRWDREMPESAPHRAIFATSADDARAQYAAISAGESFADEISPPTPPADADDAGARLEWILGGTDISKLGLACAFDLARTVVHQRDEARRALAETQDTLRDALVREYAATARADAAEARVRELHDAIERAIAAVNGYSDNDHNIAENILRPALGAVTAAAAGEGVR